MSDSVAASEVVLIGASITEQWHVDQLSRRASGVSQHVSTRFRYAFDKSPEINGILGAQRKPATVIIKACAAYFPGDLERYKTLVSGWVKQLRQAGIEPVPATTIPVTRSQPTAIYVKQLVKKYMLFRSDYVDNDRRLKAIWEYNDWLKEFARRQELRVLDLEAALIDQSQGRYLPERHTSGDGLHLNEAAYRRLDAVLLDMLAQSPVTV